MIIHSIVPIDQIFPKDNKDLKNQYRIVELNNIKAEVMMVESDIYEIIRIYSTELEDYLRPEFQPGTRIRVNFEVNNQNLHKNRW